MWGGVGGGFGEVGGGGSFSLPDGRFGNEILIFLSR